MNKFQLVVVIMMVVMVVMIMMIMKVMMVMIVMAMMVVMIVKVMMVVILTRGVKVPAHVRPISGVQESQSREGNLLNIHLKGGLGGSWTI